MSITSFNPFPSFQKTWPIVQRELRVGASKAFNHWLRALTCVIALLIFWFGMGISTLPPAQQGNDIFSRLHMLIVALLMITVPAMTADCVAREKREGTLGLLFMTPLSAEGIIIGKCFVQILRAWCLWLAILPTLTIPFVLGGVTWINLASAILVELCVGFLALAAGLLIASATQVRILAIILAEITAVIFVSLMCLAFSTYFISMLGRPINFGIIESLYVLRLPEMITMTGGALSAGLIISILIKSLLVVFLIVFLCMRIAAWHIKQNWRDKTPSPRQQWLVNRFCTELGQSAFHRKMQRTLDWNPIAFLQQYSWKSRLSKWGLCLLFVVVQCAFCDKLADYNQMKDIQTVLLLILAAMFTFVGVSSFLAEKQNGALELILITPLKVNQIILGRSWGLWKQFLPAFLSLILFHVAINWINVPSNFGGRNYYDAFFLQDWIVLMCFLSLPFFATYAALRVRYILGAALLTWIGLAMGFIFGLTTASFLNHGNFPNNPYDPTLIFCIGLSYAAFVGLTFFLLRHSLSRRIYSF